MFAFSWHHDHCRHFFITLVMLHKLLTAVTFTQGQGRWHRSFLIKDIFLDIITTAMSIVLF